MTTDSGQGGRLQSVLVIEDSPTQAEQIGHILEEGGYRVIPASSGQEALQTLGKIVPSLIITDIVMPGMDGYELCRILKDDPVHKGTPVILLTSLSEPEYVVRGLQCGADHFVTKPVDKEYLLAHIRDVLVER